MNDSLSVQYGLIFSHCAIGLLAARLAFCKGYDLGRWLIWGTIGGTAALVTILVTPHRKPLP